MGMNSKGTDNTMMTYLDMEACPHVLLSKIVPMSILHFHVYPLIFEDRLDITKYLCTVLLKIGWQLLPRRIGYDNAGLPRFPFVARLHFQRK